MGRDRDRTRGIVDTGIALPPIGKAIALVQTALDVVSAVHLDHPEREAKLVAVADRLAVRSNALAVLNATKRKALAAQ